MPAEVRRIDFRKAKEAADLVSLLGEWGITRAKVTGTRIRCECPLCGGTQTFSGDLERKIWNCFNRGCIGHGGGDVLRLVELKEQIPVREAAARLAPPTEPKSSGYIREAGARWDAEVNLRPGEDAAAWKKRLRQFFLSEVLASYKNAKK